MSYMYPYIDAATGITVVLDSDETTNTDVMYDILTAMSVIPADSKIISIEELAPYGDLYVAMYPISSRLLLTEDYICYPNKKERGE